MNTRIRRDNGKVWLEGVQSWFVGEKGSSVHAAQEAVMLAVGEKIDYHTLLGVSGLAFRMQVSKDGLCPSSPHSCCGYKCVERSVQALPWHIKVFEVKPEDTEGTTRARNAVIESIKRGVPVQYGREEDGLIIGYQAGGKEWLVLHPYKENGKEMVIENEWPWGIAVFTRVKDEIADPIKLAAGALDQAVEMAEIETINGYYSGFYAWNEYLAKLTSLLEASPEIRLGNMLGNAWIYECLIQYRRGAAAYLRHLAADFPGKGSSHLHKAASFYEQMANHILIDQENPTVVAPYPWMLKDGTGWTSGQIQGQISRLKEALPLESEAIADIKEALALLTAHEKTLP